MPRRDGRKADRTMRPEEGTRVCRIKGGNRIRTEMGLEGKQRGVHPEASEPGRCTQR